MLMPREVGRVIKNLREKAHLRQTDLSRACGVKQPNLSRIEKGHCAPRHSTLARIAEALGASVEAIEAEAAKLDSLDRSLRPGEAGGGGAKTMAVPLFDISTGQGVNFDEGGRPRGDLDMTLELPQVDAPCFACRVQGDAMLAAGREGFADGDIVVFAQRPPANGDFAFVRTREAAAFRQVFSEAQGLRLVPLNRAHEEKLVPAGEVLQAWKLVQHLRVLE
jgi:transcriptional regulator with XRE-family HTH domain